MKQLTVELHLALGLVDGSGRLSKELTRFWELARPHVVRVMAAAIPDAPLEVRQALLHRSDTAKAGIEAEWQKVARVEAEVEGLMLTLYGVKPEIYTKVIERSPVPSLDDVLLPSRAAG